MLLSPLSDEASLYTLEDESAKSGDGASDMDEKRYGQRREQRDGKCCEQCREQRYEKLYERWAVPLRSRPGVVRALRALNCGIVGVFYAAYAVLLGWACATDPWKTVPLAGVVALGFGAVSAFRSRFDAPRPYECCAIVPLVARDGAGKSFPSRHAFSAFAIAASWFAASVFAALALLLAAAALAACRVLGGVHFPRDVAAGALAGFAVGGLAAFLAMLL